MTRFDIGGGRFARAVLLILPVVAMSACGGDSTTGPPGGGGTTEQWVTALTRSWSLPSNSEAYKCHSELATTDKYYTGFRLASPSAAQTELYLLVRPSVTQVGDFDCTSSDILGGEAIYAAGAGTTPVTFSGGKGVHVAAGQYLQMIVHINNTSASPVTAPTTIEGRVAAAKDVTTPIDMFFVGRLQFPLPADSDTNVVNGSCGTLADMHVLAEIPLLRSLGTHQAFETKDASASIFTVFDSSFDYQHIVYTLLATDFLVTGPSQVNASCTYVNHTGVVVNFGESAQDESCLLGLYRYPPKPPTSNSPIECAMGIPI
jgi:hypothetical protein